MSDESESKDTRPATITATSGAAVTLDPQDPLPESNFSYRRWTTWAVLTVCLALVAVSLFWLHDLEDQEGIYQLAKYSLLLAWFVATYYYVAPSAEQLVRIIHTARIATSGLEASGMSIRRREERQERHEERAEDRQERQEEQRPPPARGEPPVAPSPAPAAAPTPPPGVANPPF